MTDNKKFHHLIGKELSVALEATLEVGSGLLDFDPELFGNGRPNQDLLYRNGDCWRAYFPAVSEGDVRRDKEATVRFIPWFSGPNVLYYRICLRAQPLYGDKFCWLKFGRFNEDKPFGFLPAKPFISLDFFSQQQDGFKPLFVKVLDDSGKLIYLVVEGEIGDEEAEIKVRRISEQDAPPHLQTAKP